MSSTRQLTIDERRSLAGFRGWKTRREGKPEVLMCPICGQRMPYGALDHERRKHVDLYQRKAHRRGELV